MSYKRFINANLYNVYASTKEPLHCEEVLLDTRKASVNGCLTCFLRIKKVDCFFLSALTQSY